ncbi:hypothetical protein [Epilithonimonas mollis]|uniref:Uncharacterized protein n=1 Tax=Epilithonimonas mollis TaxID=216903 RepID=A0A1M6TJQ9_9FLAO|nr:hypothetical protein [Epilithonimonas mollis]SHK57302.1 hypothetical protein SAMN05444371_2930 [Epilithonimonas mollis]
MGTKSLTNSYLKTLEQQVYDFHFLMLKEENFITAEGLKSKLFETVKKHGYQLS